MTTISPSSGNAANARTMHSGPYAGPHRHRRHDAGAVEAAIARIWSAAFGPYVPPHAGSALERDGTALASTSASLAVAAAGVAFLYDTDASTMDTAHVVSRTDDADAFDSSSADLANWASAESVELPWITKFLDDVAPVLPAHVSADSVMVESGVSEYEAEGEVAWRFGVDVESPVSAAWDADGVGAELRAIAEALGTHIAPATDVVMVSARYGSADDASPDVAEAAPLPMWGEDDFPAEMASVSVEGNGARRAATAASAATAALESSGTETTALAQESAAVALESLARRVRSGDLKIVRFRADQGDAASIAAALAALLGAPRRG